jgi:predicted enzyme related to lactoylglutathione lyase
MPNRFVHGVELHTKDPQAAKAFHKGLFNWEFEDIPEMQYARFAMPGADGGIMQNPVCDSPAHWAPYFLVDDVAAAVKKARSLGATVVVDTTEIPGHGWFSMVSDPTGATFGLWKGAS